MPPPGYSGHVKEKHYEMLRWKGAAGRQPFRQHLTFTNITLVSRKQWRSRRRRRHFGGVFNHLRSDSEQKTRLSPTPCCFRSDGASFLRTVGFQTGLIKHTRELMLKRGFKCPTGGAIRHMMVDTDKDKRQTDVTHSGRQHPRTTKLCSSCTGTRTKNPPSPSEGGWTGASTPDGTKLWFIQEERDGTAGGIRERHLRGADQTRGRCFTGSKNTNEQQPR